jgi:hypothetical protein
MTLQINAVFIKVFQYSQQAGVNVSQLYHQPAPLADYPSRTAAGFSWLVRVLTVLAGVGLWHGLSRGLRWRSPRERSICAPASPTRSHTWT